MTSAALKKRPASSEILSAYKAIKADKPKSRAKDIAALIGITEAELLASRTDRNIIRLEADWADLLRALPPLGQVMALTRNAHCVHEKHGKYDNINIGPGHGIVLNHDIDLRLFMSHWRYGFAVTENVASGRRQSLQFFDIDGEAVHKIYIPKDSDDAHYQKIIENFRADKQDQDLNIVALPEPRKDEPDHKIDVNGFLTHWENLQDTHDFFGLLHEFGIGRRQSMRLAHGKFTRRVTNDCLEAMLNAASETQTPIMCFVGNPGCIQIHTGEIKKVAIRGPWLNILDPNFNLHLNQSGIESIWAVQKPTKDGIVTSVEVYDDTGKCFVQFFGERKPGKAELSGWQDIVSALPNGQLGTN